MKRLMIRLSDELHQKVREKADRESVNVSGLVRNFLKEWVKEERPPPPEESGA